MLNDTGLKLENQICFALYASSKEIIKQYKPLLDPMGLTYTQYITLLVLWEKDNLTIKELGEFLYLDSGTLTPLLKKLQEQGLITRVRSQEDERTVRVSLTEKGAALKAKAAEIPEKMYCHTGLSPEEAVALHQQLNKLLNNLRNTINQGC